MQRLKYAILIVLALIMTGCGQTVVETLNVQKAPGMDAPGSGKTVVILPFADYTYADNLAASYRRNLKVTETLTDNLTHQGFALPVQEDVFQYLVNEGVIQIAEYEKNNNVSLTNELAGDWSDTMKSTIRHYMRQQQITQRNQVAKSPGAHALTSQAVAKLGREFRADYIVRGRILEFRTRQEATWAPWKRGIFPVIAGTTAQVLYGFAGSDEYDIVNQQMAGGIYGAGIGNLSDWPIDGKEIAGGVTGNEIFWAGTAGLLGLQASRSGKVDQAVVQMRIWVQDAATGQVVWTNRVSVRVSPQSILADGQYDDLFNSAIEKGVGSLIDNFVTYGL